MLKSYAKGYRAEYELVHKLSALGYMVVRTPRSGRIGLSSPDVIAAKNGKMIVIECKSRKGAFTVEESQIKELEEWVEKAGATAYVGCKIPRKGWSFVRLADVKNNKGNIGKKFISSAGVGIENICI